MKKITFFRLSAEGKKSFLSAVEVQEGKKMLRRAVAALRAKARDFNDFLHVRGNHLYFYNDRIVVE